MKKLNKNLPNLLNRNFRNNITENFDNIEKGHNELVNEIERSATPTTAKIKHDDGNLHDVINQLTQRIANLVVGENVNSNVEVKDAKVGVDGTEYGSLQERVSTEINRILDKSTASLETAEQIKAEFEASAFYNEVTYKRGRLHDTDYTIVYIPHTDSDGNLIKLKRGTKTDDFKNLELTTAREYANYKNATYVANASTFSSTPSFYGRQIVDGKIVTTTKGAADSNVWTLTIDDDNTLNAYPPDVTVQELLSKGVKNALTAYGPLIMNGKDVYATGDYVGNTTVANPRTVIGQFKNKDLIFFTCEGRVSGKDTYQKGMTLDEVTDTLFSVYGDIEFAYNLDGGGSTSAVLRNHMLNTPTDNNNKSDRKVADFLYIAKDVKTKHDLDIAKAYQDIGELKSDINFLKGLLGNFNTINSKFLFMTGYDQYTGIVINDDNGVAQKKLYISPDGMSLYDYQKKQWTFKFKDGEGLYLDGRLMARNFSNPEPVTDCNSLQRGGSYYVPRTAKGSPYPNRCAAIVTQYNVTYKDFDEDANAFQTAVPFALTPNYKMKRRSHFKGAWSQWYDV